LIEDCRDLRVFWEVEGGELRRRVVRSGFWER